MAKPIDVAPDSAMSGAIPRGVSADEDLAAILTALAESGALSFLRALLEQREALADRLLEQMNSEPTRRGLRILVTFAMGLGSLPEDSGTRVTDAISSALAQADAALKAADGEKMSIWVLLGFLKDPDIARAIHYLAGFIKGLGAYLENP